MKKSTFSLIYDYIAVKCYDCIHACIVIQYFFFTQGITAITTIMGSLSDNFSAVRTHFSYSFLHWHQ